MLALATVAFGPLAVASAVRFRRETTIVSGLQSTGAALLIVMVLTHVAEA